MTKLQKHKRYFRFFTVLSVLGIIEVATHQFIATRYGLSDTGVIAFYVGMAFSYVSPRLAGVIMTFLSVTVSLVIFWAPIAIVEYRMVKKLEKEDIDKKDAI